VRHRFLSRLVSVFIICLLASPSADLRLQARQVRAAGGPIVDCSGGPLRLARLERGMPVQREALRRIEEQLKAAQEGNLQALRDRESADVVRQKVDSWIGDQKDMLVDAAASRLTGVPADKIADYKEKLAKWQSSFEKLQKSAKAGYAYGVAIRENAAAFKDYMTVLQFLDDSGIGEQTARLMAKATFGPAGDKAIDAFNLARDWTLAELQQNISDQQLGQLRDTYYAMLGAVMNNHEKIENLRAMLGTCPGAPKPQVQDSPKPIPPQTTSAPPAAPAPAPKAKKGGKGGGAGTALLIALPIAGAAAWYAGKTLSEAYDTLDDGTGGGSGGSPKVISFSNPWVCSGSTCSGTVTIEFPSVMNTGSIIVVSTSSFMGQANVSPTSPPGKVTFTMTKSYVTCYQTQRELAIWNGTNINGPQTYGITGLNIPVSCQ
jgi:hypothetical protein